MTIDHELLRMIMENNPGKPPAYVVEQYNTYLKGLEAIHADSKEETSEVFEQTQINVPHTKEAKTSITCGFTKRHLKVKPENAIADDTITCCLCEGTYKTLTAKHLATHNGLTREGYIKLCGYPAKQPLMSKNYLVTMKKTVLKAQLARSEKKKRATEASEQAHPAQ